MIQVSTYDNVPVTYLFCKGGNENKGYHPHILDLTSVYDSKNGIPISNNATSSNDTVCKSNCRFICVCESSPLTFDPLLGD